jgi:hypothetical protein
MAARWRGTVARPRIATTAFACGRRQPSIALHKFLCYFLGVRRGAATRPAGAPDALAVAPDQSGGSGKLAACKALGMPEPFESQPKP